MVVREQNRAQARFGAARFEYEIVCERLRDNMRSVSATHLNAPP
jgi:hypothetical protein